MHLILVSMHVRDVGVEGLSQSSAHTSPEGFEKLLSSLGATEGFSLNTCNRIEFVFVTESQVPDLSLREKFSHSIRIFRGRREVIHHLLEVALSKDSMVFGESQILGQFKRAYQKAIENRQVRNQLNPLFNSIIREAKSVRARVGLTQVHTSVSTVAGQEIVRKAGSSPLRVGFFGAGETNMILARYLKKRRPCEFTWTSRTRERAQVAMDALGGNFVDWEFSSQNGVGPVDVIAVATHSREILITESILKASKPKLVCDLSVPPNADRELTLSKGIQYVGIDDLNQILEETQKLSANMLHRIDSEILNSRDRIENELRIRDSKALLSSTARGAEELVQRELAGLMEAWPQLSEIDRKRLEQWTLQLSKRITHAHLESLKSVIAASPPAQESVDDLDAMS